ncbi:MAG TPA: UDP-N-acetylmuramoyl-tripeptide--D-alanyl-D-alanine ligase [Candidatus Kapabacteria bacterium]|nr:UDP-N-acetylmuramoyl-tripeptide--D-alanyl-D-alanine ligase [Candidatus Kapabacteria bacterium]
MSIETIRDLLRELENGRYNGSARTAARAVRGFSTDSRSLKKGEVFVALQGETFNGHDFIGDVARRGAAAAVVSSAWDGDAAGLPLIAVDDTLAAYGTIATAHRMQFTIPVIAVAGSNGKTTTKELIADLLAERHTVLRTEGNLNNLIGVPATMLRLNAAHTAAVVEIGTNTPGEIAKLASILRPTHGIITNIGREHLELLGSIEGVAREEGALFEYLAIHGGTAFVNQDDPLLRKMGRRLERRITFGRGAGADISGRRGALDERGAPKLAICDRRRANAKELEVQLRTPGLHTAGNALAAAAVALALRVPGAAVKRALEGFEAKVYHGGYARLAPMTAANGARLLNDTYNANPDSVLAGLATLAAMKPARGGIRIAVLADMKELGRSSAREHTRIGEEIAGMPKIGLALFHGTEMKRAYRALLKSGAAMRMKPMYFDTKEELAETLLAILSEQDIVFIKGSRGMKMEEVVAKLL